MYLAARLNELYKETGASVGKTISGGTKFDDADNGDFKFNFLQLNQIEVLTNLIRDRIKPRVFNHSSIDGEALFGVIQNFIENLNLDEIPIIKNALDNILLDRANNKITKIFEEYKKIINDRFPEKALPLEISEIYIESEKMSSEFISKLAEKLDDALRPKQIAQLFIDALNKIHYQMSIILETNKKLFDEWFDEEHTNIIKNLNIKEVICFKD